MKTLFQQYKPFLLFLFKFFFAYGLLTFIYRLYLSFCTQHIDLFTTLTAVLSKNAIKLFNKDVNVVTDLINHQYQYYINAKYIARIIEGCNSISVIILFIAFIIAFSNRLKPTLLFICFGSILLFVLNIFRIVILMILIYQYPQHEPLLHGVVFPLIIYSIVFLLWIYWIKNYSHYASKTTLS